MKDALLGVDPGTEQTAYCLYRDGRPAEFDILPNSDFLAKLPELRKKAELMAIEMVASYGMAVGKEVFETVFWSGRFVQAWDGPFRKVYRQEVKLHLCKDSRAKDANIRQAILDRYPRSGGGKTPQIGTKKEPGPLYGVSSHVWAAMSVAIVAAETKHQIPT